MTAFYLIHFICAGGHQQNLRIDKSLGKDYAINLAQLMDGSSPLYVHPPDEKSMIGKCGICGKKVTATVYDQILSQDHQDQG